MKSAYKTFPTSSTAVDQVSGQTFTSYYDVFTIGAGYLDVAALLANHDVVSGTAMSPLAFYNAADGKVYLKFFWGFHLERRYEDLRPAGSVGNAGSVGEQILSIQTRRFGERKQSGALVR